MVIEGNELEGIGGPAIIVFGMTDTIQIKSNYIATTNEGRVTSEGRGAGSIGARTYGPLVLRPFCGLNPTGYNGVGCFGSPKNITVMADIVINGCLTSTDCLSIPPKMDPFSCVSTYCSTFPTTGIKISANYHGMDTPAAVRMNKTNTAGSDIAWGAYLGIAMINADILDNSCTGGGCENEPRSVRAVRGRLSALRVLL
jgi:hypothetical protein